MDATDIPLVGVQGQRIEALHKAAVEVEANFLSEMLKSAKLYEAKGPFSGGVGEDQFASFLREQQALALAETGGVGLAEMIFESLKEQAHASE